MWLSVPMNVSRKVKPLLLLNPIRPAMKVPAECNWSCHLWLRSRLGVRSQASTLSLIGCFLHTPDPSLQVVKRYRVKKDLLFSISSFPLSLCFERMCMYVCTACVYGYVICSVSGKTTWCWLWVGEPIHLDNLQSRMIIPSSSFGSLPPIGFQGCHWLMSPRCRWMIQERGLIEECHSCLPGPASIGSVPQSATLDDLGAAK